MNRKYVVRILGTFIVTSLIFSGCGTKNKENVKDNTKSSIEQKNSNEENKLEFTTKTIMDKDVDSKIFSNYKLTMINLWGTSCGPCVSELPALQKVYQEEYGNGVNVLGVVADIRDYKDAEMKDRAKELISQTGVKYDNLIADKNLMIYFSSISDAIPTTVFVDHNGKVIGKPISGMRTKEEYKKIIKERLKSVK